MERTVVSCSWSAGGSCVGVRERPRDVLRRGGGEDIVVVIVRVLSWVYNVVDVEVLTMELA